MMVSTCSLEIVVLCGKKKNDGNVKLQYHDVSNTSKCIGDIRPCCCIKHFVFVSCMFNSSGSQQYSMVFFGWEAELYKMMGNHQVTNYLTSFMISDFHAEMFLINMFQFGACQKIYEVALHSQVRPWQIEDCRLAVQECLFLGSQWYDALMVMIILHLKERTKRVGLLSHLSSSFEFQ